VDGHYQVLPKAFLAAVYVDLGRLNEAKASANEVMQLNPSFTATRLIKSHTFHDPKKDTQFRDLMHRAGLSESQRQQELTVAAQSIFDCLSRLKVLQIIILVQVIIVS
jgi:hypothetical protein